MTSKPFLIASDMEGKSPDEVLLHNLELRLKLQKEWVSRTEYEIEQVKERINQEKEKMSDGL